MIYEPGISMFDQATKSGWEISSLNNGNRLFPRITNFVFFFDTFLQRWSLQFVQCAHYIFCSFCFWRFVLIFFRPFCSSCSHWAASNWDKPLNQTGTLPNQTNMHSKTSIVNFTGTLYKLKIISDRLNETKWHLVFRPRAKPEGEGICR